MIITHKIDKMDLSRQHVVPVVNVMQDDKYSRNLEITLVCNGVAWEPPSDATVIVRYRKSDGTGGNYDTLPDGTIAGSIAGNVVTVALAPQVCTAPGVVHMAVGLVSGEAEINTFAVKIDVQPNPGVDVASENYSNLSRYVASTGWTPNMYLGTDEDGNVVTVEGNQATGGANIDVTAEVGQGIVVKAVDADGKPTEWEAKDLQERTHWDTRTFDEIFPETTFAGSIAIITEPIPQITAGEYGTGVFRVVFDGLTYDVAYQYSQGVYANLDGDDIFAADELAPFYIMGYYHAANSSINYNNYQVNLIAKGDIIIDHTAAVYIAEGELVTLPEKFLPPNVQPPLVVTVTGTTEDGENYVYTADYTEQQIVNAHESGRVVMCKLIQDGLEYILALSMASQISLDDEGTEVYPAAVFSGAVEGVSCEVFLFLGEVNTQFTDTIPPNQLPNPCPMGINGVYYNGEETVSFTNTINDMIDAKIPAVPTKTSELTNDSGYLTSAPVTSVNGQTGAVSLDIPTVPTALPNPSALTIDGTAYDGSEEVTVYTGNGKSVLAYGAKGDGATDDTAAFQAALAENRVVRVPGGTYVLSGTLVINANCCLELSQDTVLKFTQASGNCIVMQGGAALRGNHAIVEAPYAFTGNALAIDTDLETDTIIPPYLKVGSHMFKRQRFVYDLNIIKPTSAGFCRSNDGTCNGTAVYMCATSTASAHMWLWAITMSGIRIAGAFNYGIRAVNNDSPSDSSGHYEDDAWNHDMRIEAVIEACEVGVSLENCNTAHLAVTVQPSAAMDGTRYAKYGVYINDSKYTDMIGSRVWDWNANTSLWTAGGEYQHIALIGDCRGLLLDDFLVHATSTDIKELIYTDLESNFDKMTILQEPGSKYFKSVDGEPYFSNGSAEQRLALKSDIDEYFQTERVAGFTDALATAIDTDGSVYNGIGYNRYGGALSSAGEIISGTEAYYGHTGFIPCKAGDTIYIKDIAIGNNDGYTKAFAYDANFNLLGQNSTYAIIQGTAVGVFAGTGTETGGTLTPVKADTAYIRLGFKAVYMGSDPIISVNKEIKFVQEGFLTDGVRVRGENVVLTSPGGKTFTLSVDDAGTLTAQAFSV